MLTVMGAASAGAWYVREHLPQAGPVPDLVAPTDPATVERGRYLTQHVAGCLVCHTPHDLGVVGQPLPRDHLGAGGVPFGREEAVPGLVISTNLTPEGLGGWSDGAIVYALTTGVNPSREVAHTIMPWTRYRSMARPDLLAIVAYLRTLEPIPTAHPSRALDPGVTLSLNLMAEEATLAAEAPRGEVEYGAYLALIAGCEDCHTPAGPDGRADPAMRYGGGNEWDVPGHARIRSTNLTPDEATGIGGLTRGAFIGSFQQHRDDPLVGQRWPDGVPVTVMPWPAYSGMTDADLGAIYAFLRTLPPVVNRVVVMEPTPGGPEPDLANMPKPPRLPDGYADRMTVGALCDEVDAARAPGLFTEPADPALVAAIAQRVADRDAPDGAVLAARLADPLPDRATWLRENVRLHGLAGRCGPVLGAIPPE